MTVTLCCAAVEAQCERSEMTLAALWRSHSGAAMLRSPAMRCRRCVLAQYSMPTQVFDSL